MKVFIKEQRFTQVWLHILLAISLLIPALLITRELVEKGWQDEDNLKSYYSPDYPLSKKLVEVVTSFIKK